MSPARYTRDELARLEKVLRSLAGALEDSEWEDTGDPQDLRAAADFLAETVGTLDRQKRARDRKAAARIIERRQRRGRR